MPENQIAEILAAIPLPAVLVDRLERISAANAEALNLLGAGIVSRHFGTILRQPPVTEAIEATLRDQAPRSARHLASEGTTDLVYDVSVRYVPSLAPNEKADPGAVLVSFQDMTHHELAGQMRRDFVANVSHELRTPLTALLGFIETLQGPAREDATARDRFLGIMETEAGRMNRLVGDLLSLSRVEADERVRPREQVDLSELLNSTVASLRPLADQAGVELHLNGADHPMRIAGDNDQLRQVFSNLVENAIKYGGAGGDVWLTLTGIERDPSLRVPAVQVAVADRGPGIAPEHLPRLTERFYRGDSHRSRQLGGTGLGLAIVKHIVNRHRGRLRINSEPGQGAVFTVILPREQI